MTLETGLVAAVAALVPTAVGGLIAWLAKDKLVSIASAIATLVAEVKELRKDLANHATQLAVVLGRVEALENVRVVRLEAEVGELRAKVHELETQAARHARRSG
jgi:outer membrane murein-binding lipoprotein Lpp